MSRQCESKTSTGARCKRTSKDGCNMCFQHLKMCGISVEPSYQPPRRSTRGMGVASRPKKDVLIIDLTLDEEDQQDRSIVPRRMETRLQKRLNLQQHMGQVLNAIQEIQQDRIRDHPPRRPRQKTHQHKHHSSNGRCEDCCICYDAKVREERFLECGHILCEGCISNLRDDRCPICRKEVQSKFISNAEKKRMRNRKRDDDEERNEELYQAYMVELVRETRQRYNIVLEF